MSMAVGAAHVALEMKRLGDAVETALLHVDVDIALASDLEGQSYADFEALDFPYVEPGIDGVILVRGEREARDAALTELINLADELREAGGPELHVSTSGKIWCQCSAVKPVYAGTVTAATAPVVSVGRLEDDRGLWFLCSSAEPHAHQWRNVKPSGELT